MIQKAMICLVTAFAILLFGIQSSMAQCSLNQRYDKWNATNDSQDVIRTCGKCTLAERKQLKNEYSLNSELIGAMCDDFNKAQYNSQSQNQQFYQQPQYQPAFFCCDAFGNRRCQLVNSVPIGYSCVCPGQGWGLACL